MSSCFSGTNYRKHFCLVRGQSLSESCVGTGAVGTFSLLFMGVSDTTLFSVDTGTAAFSLEVRVLSVVTTCRTEGISTCYELCSIVFVSTFLVLFFVTTCTQLLFIPLLSVCTCSSLLFFVSTHST